MTKRREAQKIEAKEREWERIMRPVDKWGRYIKKMLKKAMNWYWFDNSKSDGSKALHIIMWAVITMGITGWWNLAFGGR